MLQLTIANWSGVLKKGVTLKLTDFLPKWCLPKRKKKSPEVIESQLKASLCGLAKLNKTN